LSSEFDSSILFFNQSLKLYKFLQNKKKTAEIYDKIGSCYYSGKADYKTAMKFYLKSLEISEKTNDSIGMAYSLNNIANIYFRLEKREKALETYIEALKFAEKTNDKKITAILLNNIGTEFAFKENYELAIDYHLKAVEIKKELNNPVSLAVTYTSIGSILKYQNKLDEALEYYNNSLKIFEKYSNKNYIATVYNYIAAVYKEKNNYSTAIQYLIKSLSISEEINSNKLTENNYKGLAEVYNNINNFQLAYKYFEKYTIIHDSIYSQESNKALHELQIKYETDKKIKEIKILERDNQISKLQIEKEKSKSYTLRIVLILLFILIIISILFAIFLYNRFKFKQKVNKILESKNEELNETNKKLAESENNLKELITTKDKFFSIIAHDLRSPLSSLTLVSEVIDQNINELNKEKIGYLIGSINKAANNLLELVENLLYWASTQTGKINFNPQSVNISQVIKQNISLLKLTSDKKSIEIINLVNSDYYTFSDINLLTTIIRNLLTNAIKFTNTNGTIHIKLSDNNDFYEIQICDNGIGISQENINKLFRIEIDTRQIGDSTEKGTGLGLILCKELVEKNGGTIKVESILNEGSTFSFTVKKEKI
jgi:signal transduction histidine kinase